MKQKLNNMETIISFVLYCKLHISESVSRKDVKEDKHSFYCRINYGVQLTNDITNRFTQYCKIPTGLELRLAKADLQNDKITDGYFS